MIIDVSSISKRERERERERERDQRLCLYVWVLHFTNSGSNVHVLQPNSIRQLFCPFDFALDHRSSMSDSHKKRGRDDNDDVPNKRPYFLSSWTGDERYRPCTFCGNHFTSSHDWSILWGPEGRAYAYLCVKCQNKWKYGEKVANEMDKKDDKKDDQNDDKKDDMNKKDDRECLLRWDMNNID